MSNTHQDQHFVKNAVDAAINIGVLFGLVMWCFNIAAPFIQVILWGIIIAIGASPIYHWINDKLGGRKGLAASVFIVLMSAVLITPSVYFSESLLSSVQALSTDIEDNTLSIPAPPDAISDLPLIGEKAYETWHFAHQQPQKFLGQYETQVMAGAKFFVQSFANIGLSILMFLFAIILAGLFLANATGGRTAAIKIMSRFFGDRGEPLTNLAQQTVQSVVTGILGIAVLQSILAGAGFLAMDIPGAAILTIICLILAVVQIDILIILIPLSIFAFSHVGTATAIAFLIWNIIVGLMNNVLKPILLGRGVKAPMAVVFIGAIGGMLAHGIIGLFVGAVVFVLGYTLFADWVKQEDAEADSKAE